jgi:hypothetical protein
MEQLAASAIGLPQQDALFALCFTDDVRLQMEALPRLLEIGRSPGSNLYVVFLRHDLFDPFLTLLTSHAEAVRFRSLALIFFIFERLSPVSPDDFDLIAVSVIGHLSENAPTVETWAFAIEATERLSLARFAFPIACAVSHFIDAVVVCEFIDHLLRVVTERPEIGAAIASAHVLYFWALYLMLQSRNEPFQVGPTDPAIQKVTHRPIRPFRLLCIF